jgi:hypothetical protein
MLSQLLVIKKQQEVSDMIDDHAQLVERVSKLE